MAEATQIIGQQRSAVIATLARQAAIKAVKGQLQAQGLKLHHFAQRTIVAAADEYLAEHRQALVEEAAEKVRTSPALRALYDREQRRRQQLLERISANMHSERRPDL